MPKLQHVGFSASVVLLPREHTSHHMYGFCRDFVALRLTYVHRHVDGCITCLLFYVSHLYVVVAPPIHHDFVFSFEWIQLKVAMYGLSEVAQFAISATSLVQH